MVDALSTLRLDRAETRLRVPLLPVGVRMPNSTASDGHRNHVLVWNGSTWFCSVCLYRTLLPMSDNSKRRCPGPPAFSGLLQDHRGHELSTAAVSGGGVILFCRKCYHYASPHPRKLSFRCSGRPENRSSEKFYLSRLVHPVGKQRLLHPVRVPNQFW